MTGCSEAEKVAQLHNVATKPRTKTAGRRRKEKTPQDMAKEEIAPWAAVALDPAAAEITMALPETAIERRNKFGTLMWIRNENIGMPPEQPQQLLSYLPNSEIIKSERSLLLAALEEDPYGRPLQFASPKLQGDKQIVLTACRNLGWAFQFASPNLKSDKRFVLDIVRIDGRALQFASLELRNDTDVVIAAVEKYGSLEVMKKYVPKDRQKDIEERVVVALAKRWRMSSSSNPLKEAPRELRSKRAFVLEFLKHDGRTLQYAPENLRNDEMVAMSAVRQNGLALQYASASIQNNRNVVWTSVQQDGWALQFASSNLKMDKDIATMAIKSNPDAIKFVHNDIKHDPELLVLAGMFDESHEEQRQQRHRTIKKIALSTRFSLSESCDSDATNFTSLLKSHDYIQNGGGGNFKVYAPNAFDKQTCDPNWTNFCHPCRGTKDTCQFDDALKTGHPTDECCWRYSFQWQLQQAKNTGGFMLQLVEKQQTQLSDTSPPTLGDGQRIEHDMAKSLGLKIFQVYRPMYKEYEAYFEMHHVEEVVDAIQQWYEGECQDMSDCIVRPEF